MPYADYQKRLACNRECWKRYADKLRARGIRRRNKVSVNRTAAMKYYQSLREKILDGYGRRCACCGEDTVTFLALDHVGGGGAKHRKEKQNNGRIYLEVIKAGFPVKYRLLCHNCNFAVSIMSACPHSTNEYGVGAC